MSRRRRTRTLAEIEEDYLTPDEETEVQRKRRKANKRKAISRFNAELRRQAHDEEEEFELVLAQDLDEETKKDSLSKRRSKMFISDDESRMQRKREQDRARAARRRAMQSDQDRQRIRELDRERKARHRAQLKDEFPRYLVYKASCSLLPARVAGQQQPCSTKTEMQNVQEIIISVREIMNCTDILEAVPGLCTQTCVTASDIEVEEDSDIPEEEDPLAVTLPAVKAEQENCTDVLEPVPGFCTETCLTPSDIKVEEDSDIPAEEDPLAVTSPSIKAEQENCTDVLEAVPGLCTETCLTACDDGKKVADIKFEEDSDIPEEEEPSAVTSPAVKTEQESLQNSESCIKAVD